MSQPLPPPPPPPPPGPATSQAFCPYCSYPLQPGTETCPTCGRPVSTAAGGPAAKRGAGKWVLATVLGAGCLLVLLFVGGIVAAIAIPAFTSAKERTKQKQALDEMRQAAVALEAFRAQTGVYPGGESFADVATQLTAHGWPAGKTTDPWGHAYRWGCWEPDGDGCASYELVTPGRDGVFESNPDGGYSEGAFAADQFDADIVVNDGMFSRWPEGQGRLATQGG